MPGVFENAADEEIDHDDARGVRGLTLLPRSTAISSPRLALRSRADIERLGRLSAIRRTCISTSALAIQLFI
jgi:hypothetical protein